MRTIFLFFSAFNIAGECGGAIFGGCGYPVLAHPDNNKKDIAVNKT
ncbi:MAG: hypothetical protein ACP5NA_02495 [Candidatus Acidulodesulfobacterium sp.]